MNRPAQPPDHDLIEKLYAGLDRKFGHRAFRRKDIAIAKAWDLCRTYPTTFEGCN